MPNALTALVKLMTDHLRKKNQTKEKPNQKLAVHQALHYEELQIALFPHSLTTALTKHRLRGLRMFTVPILWERLSLHRTEDLNARFPLRRSAGLRRRAPTGRGSRSQDPPRRPLAPLPYSPESQATPDAPDRRDRERSPPGPPTSGAAPAPTPAPPRGRPSPLPPPQPSPARPGASPVPSPPPARPEAAGRFIRRTGPLRPACRHRRRQTAPPPRRRSRYLMWRRPGSAAAPARRAQGQARLPAHPRRAGPGGSAGWRPRRGSPNRPQTNLLPSPSPPPPD